MRIAAIALVFAGTITLNTIRDTLSQIDDSG